MHWLTTVSIAMLNAHLAMLPRLNAEESLLRVRVSAVGAGSLPKEISRAEIGRWERTAKGINGVQAKPTLPEMTPEVRALMGLDTPVQVAV